MNSTITWKRTVLFSIGLVGVMISLNLIGGIKKDKSDKWFGPVLESTQEQPFEAIFVGTSRVAASIDPAAFDSTVSAALQRPFKSYNLGMGYTKTTEYWFALKNLLEKKPKALQNRAVFLEAPHGMGEFARWTDDWIVANGISPLASYLKSSDIPRFLAKSSTPWENKVLITLHVLFGFDENFSRLRYHSFSALKSAIGHSATKKNEKTSDSIDLSTAGGIRTDSEGLEFVRSAAIAVAKEELKNQKHWQDFDSSVLHDIVELVHSAGGKVYFMNLPVCSIQAEPLNTQIRQEDRLAFQQRIIKWGSPMLSPEFSVTDEDFPDYWHLRKSRSSEFSSKLAQTFLAAQQNP